MRNVRCQTDEYIIVWYRNDTTWGQTRAAYLLVTNGSHTQIEIPRQRRVRVTSRVLYRLGTWYVFCRPVRRAYDHGWCVDILIKINHRPCFRIPDRTEINFNSHSRKTMRERVPRATIASRSGLRARVARRVGLQSVSRADALLGVLGDCAREVRVHVEYNQLSSGMPPALC